MYGTFNPGDDLGFEDAIVVGKLPDFVLNLEAMDPLADNLTALLHGLNTLTPTQLRSPRVVSQIDNRLNTIATLTGISVESIKIDFDAMVNDTYSSEAGVFQAIWDFIVKVAKWVADKITNIGRWIAGLFTRGKARRVKTAANIAKATAANQANKTPKSPTYNIIVPNTALLVFHTQSQVPKAGMKYTSQHLKETFDKNRNSLRYLVNKLDGDFDKYLQGINELVNSSGEITQDKIRRASIKMGEARGLRGLERDKWSAIGFHVTAKPNKIAAKYHQTLYSLETQDTLFQQWRSAPTQPVITFERAEYLNLAKYFDVEFTALEQAITKTVDKLVKAKDLTKINDKLSHYKNERDNSSGSTKARHNVVVAALTLTQELVRSMVSVATRLGVYYERYAEMMSRIMQLGCDEYLK